jgi:predicted esterase
MRWRPALGCLSVALAVLACRDASTEVTPTRAATASASMTAPPPQVATPAPEAPVQALTIPVEGDLPVFHVAGRRGAPSRMVFLHGACTHGLGYIQSFAFAAAERGSLMALQGENACGGGLRSWTSTPQKAHARIQAGFAAANDPREGPIVLIGYSQGAMVAASLAAAFPKVYPRLILIGAPRVVDARSLAALEGAVLMSGTLDNPALMKQSDRVLQNAGVPSTFIELPGARHGQLPDAEAVMGKALAWLDDHARPR